MRCGWISEAEGRWKVAEVGCGAARRPGIPHIVVVGFRVTLPTRDCRYEFRPNASSAWASYLLAETWPLTLYVPFYSEPV